MFSDHKKQCGQVDHAKVSLMSPTALYTRVSPWFHLVRGRAGTVGRLLRMSDCGKVRFGRIPNLSKHLVDFFQRKRRLSGSQSQWARGANLPAKHVD